MEISRWYARFSARTYRNRNNPENAPEKGARTPRTPSGVRMLISFCFQGYAKNAYPWLESWHRSAVRLRLMAVSTTLL